MSTDKLYELDGSLYRFDAVVTGCRAENGDFAVTLDRTAFFPGGGGQEPDSGSLGGQPVRSVREQDGEILHILSAPLTVGASVTGELDRELRFRRMQNHGGEHIVSGIVNRQYGFNNVGFHMGTDDVTIDFDGVLDRAQLTEVEELANAAVVADRRINISFPSAEELKTLSYRSKRPLEGRIRIVEVEDFDRCACCAPHLPSTGGVGLIKILDFIHYKGGIRLHLLCGFDAIADYHRRYIATAGISTLLSVKQHEVYDAVRRLYDELGALRGECGELRRKLLQCHAASISETSGNICAFEDADAAGMRYFANLCVDKCDGVCAVFVGDDATGYRYVIASRAINLRDFARGFNAALNGRGGGSAEMIQGSVSAVAEDIKNYLTT